MITHSANSRTTTSPFIDSLPYTAVLIASGRPHFVAGQTDDNAVYLALTDQEGFCWQLLPSCYGLPLDLPWPEHPPSVKCLRLSHFSGQAPEHTRPCRRRMFYLDLQGIEVEEL